MAFTQSLNEGDMAYALRRWHRPRKGLSSKFSDRSLNGLEQENGVIRPKNRVYPSLDCNKRVRVCIVQQLRGSSVAESEAEVIGSERMCLTLLGQSEVKMTDTEQNKETLRQAR